MDEHIKCICKQASSKLYALARISHYLNDHKKRILMKTFIISQFNYCPIIWMYCQRKSNNLINRVHERALRIAYSDYLSDFKTLLEKDNSVTIHQRNIQSLSVEVYKSLNNLNPDFMKEFFCLKQIITQENKTWFTLSHARYHMALKHLGTRQVNYGEIFRKKFNKPKMSPLLKLTSSRSVKIFVTATYVRHI